LLTGGIVKGEWDRRGFLFRRPDPYNLAHTFRNTKKQRGGFVGYDAKRYRKYGPGFFADW
jgi:hypothetical protein